VRSANHTDSPDSRGLTDSEYTTSFKKRSVADR
jgi:hypothetical protein